VSLKTRFYENKRQHCSTERVVLRCGDDVIRFKTASLLLQFPTKASDLHFSNLFFVVTAPTVSLFYFIVVVLPFTFSFSNAQQIKMTSRLNRLINSSFSSNTTNNNSKVASSLPSHATTSATTSHNTSNKSIVPRRSVSRKSIFSAASSTLSLSAHSNHGDAWEAEWRNGPPSSTYHGSELIGQGTFGTVYRTKCPNTGEIVAIKRVLHNPQYKMRELDIMKRLQEVRHPNIIRLKHHFYNKASNVNPSAETYLHLVMDFIPETLASMIGLWNKNRKKAAPSSNAPGFLPLIKQASTSMRKTADNTESATPSEEVEASLSLSARDRDREMNVGCGEDGTFPFMLDAIYMFQLCRGLAHLHGLGIAHRDIKPQNILIDPHRNTLKICDFGSAKTLLQGETHLAYICSRYYRAPELILAGKNQVLYDYSIDIWAAGCVFAEMFLGQPLFPGISAADQIIEIANVLGSPSSYQLYAMDPEQKAVFRFPSMMARGLESVLPATCCSIETLDLLRSLLCYNPNDRIHMINACAHPYFTKFRENIGTLLRHDLVSMDICCFCPEELIYASEETTETLMIYSNVGRIAL
jgi:serine/threonine protein kinase